MTGNKYCGDTCKNRIIVSKNSDIILCLFLTSDETVKIISHTEVFCVLVWFPGSESSTASPVRLSDGSAQAA